MTDMSDDELSHDQDDDMSGHMTNHNGASYEMDDHMTDGDRSHDHDESHVTNGLGDPSPRSRHSNVKASRTEALEKLAKKRISGLKTPRSVKRTPKPPPEPKSTKRPRLARRSEFLDSNDEDDTDPEAPSQGDTRGSPSQGGPPSEEPPHSLGGTGSLRLGNRRQHFLDSESDESDDDDIVGSGRSVKMSRVQGEESPEEGEGLEKENHSRVRLEGSRDGEGQDEGWSSDEEHNLVICE